MKRKLLAYLAVASLVFVAFPSASAQEVEVGQMVGLQSEDDGKAVWACDAPLFINCDLAAAFAVEGCASIPIIGQKCISKTGGIGSHFSSISLQPGGSMIGDVEGGGEREFLACQWNAPITASGGCLDVATLDGVCDQVETTVVGNLDLSEDPNLPALQAPIVTATSSQPDCEDLIDEIQDLIETQANLTKAQEEAIRDDYEESFKENIGVLIEAWRSDACPQTAPSGCQAVMGDVYDAIEDALKNRAEDWTDSSSTSSEGARDYQITRAPQPEEASYFHTTPSPLVSPIPT